MIRYEIEESGYAGLVWPGSQEHHRFYFYSISRTPRRERLFDGVAGDMAEALSTMQEHIRYMALNGGTSAEE
jgi:hypothetical protein